MPTPPSIDAPLPISATVSAEAPVRAHRPSDFGAPKLVRRGVGKGRRPPRPSTDSHPIIGWCPTCQVGLTQVPCLLCKVRAIKAAERKKTKGSQ